MNNFKKIFHFLYQILLYFWYVFKFLFMSIPHLLRGIKKLIFFFHCRIGGKKQRVKKLFHFSITFKITFVYALIISVLLFLSTAAVLLGFRFFLFEQVGLKLEKNYQMLYSSFTEKRELPIDKMNEIAAQEDLILSFFNAEKQVLYTTERHSEEVQFQQKIDAITLQNLGNKQMLQLNRKSIIGDQIYYIQLEKSLVVENVYLKLLFIVLAVVNGAGIIVILLIGSSVSRKMLSPIDTMTETVKAITVQDLDTRLDISCSQDELLELAETFNEMLDGIQQAYEKQNQFVSDASHELRTPISVIQGYANLLDRWGKDDRAVLEESIAAIKGESENMKSLIEKLLFLARSDKGLQKLDLEVFSLKEMLEEIVRETKLIDDSHEVICEITEELSIYADRKSLKQALRIFVDNSVKYTPPQGTIRIGASPQKKSIVIVIEDNGIGIRPEDLPHIFDRFYRADKSRTRESGGHGLGLSIAKWVIDKHSGQIEVASTLNVGTKVSIFLPIENKS